MAIQRRKGDCKVLTTASAVVAELGRRRCRTISLLKPYGRAIRKPVVCSNLAVFNQAMAQLQLTTE